MDKGFKIKILRERKGISQKEVALKLGISQSAFCKMEACEERISIENCAKIAKIIGVHIGDILDFESKYILAEKDKLNELAEIRKQNEVLLNEIEELKEDNRILIRLLNQFKDKLI